MESEKVISFESLNKTLGRFSLQEKIFLIPQMNRIGSHLLAAAFRGFGIQAKVMDTFEGLDLGMEYTSGKECYPCQITTGDILSFMKKEQERLGKAFDPDQYIYFMPESSGPCRFGMYNKYQRIILDSLPELHRLKIGSLTTDDGYALTGLIDRERVSDLRRTSYFSVVVADILDRVLWRIRPYEKDPGTTDCFIEEAMHRMEEKFERHGPGKEFDRILDAMEEIIDEGKRLVNPHMPRKPLIGMVGEIYVRTHVHANQDIIRVIEQFGGEVVNASIAEWMNYTSYDRLRDAKTAFRLSMKQLRFAPMREHLKKMFGYGAELYYQEFRQKKAYDRLASKLDIVRDHRVAHLEEVLKEKDLYSFDAGTEACLSIPGIVQYAREGCNGVVNVYPFTCMPSTITSSIIKPIMNQLGLPYLDTPYDATVQPGREAAIRTFMYQACQHFKQHGRKAV